MIINIIGQSGSGKTSVAKHLFDMIDNSVNIDEDEIKSLFYDDGVNSRKYVKNIYNTALYLESKGFFPIISCVSPYLDLREDLKRRTEVLECYLFTSEARGREIFFVDNFEPPKSYFLPFDTTGENPQRIADAIFTCYNTKHFKNIVILKKEKDSGI